MRTRFGLAIAALILMRYPFRHHLRDGGGERHMARGKRRFGSTREAKEAESEGILISSIDTPNGGFVCRDYGEASEVYVDGIAQINMGPQVCKLRFFTTESVVMDGDKVVEKRAVTHSIVMPMSQVIELTQTLMSNFQNARERFVDGAKALDGAMEPLLDRIK